MGWGEIFFARTHAARGYIGAGATIWGAAMFDGWAIADAWRTDGRKIFRPHTCGALFHWARTTIHGVAMVNGWVMVD